MVLIGAPSPAVVQCANALFLAAAIVQDVLVIRLLLSGAFICLIVDACRLAQETGVLQGRRRSLKRPASPRKTMSSRSSRRSRFKRAA